MEETPEGAGGGGPAEGTVRATLGCCAGREGRRRGVDDGRGRPEVGGAFVWRATLSRRRGTAAGDVSSGVLSSSRCVMACTVACVGRGKIAENSVPEKIRVRGVEHL